MWDFLANLFDTSGFPPRWECGDAWAESTWLGWLHIIADLATFFAYYAVPAVVLYFVLRHRNVKFPPVFYVFLGLVFFSCGTVHLVEAGLFVWPIYRFSAVVKLLTALVSCVGVIVLAKVLPIALELKSGEAYRKEASGRKRAEEKLQFERNLLYTLMNHHPDGIYFKDRSGRFLRVSKAYAGKLGSDDPEDALGKTDSEFFSDEHSRESSKNEQQILESGEPAIGLIKKETRSDGTETWISTSMAPFYDQQGDVIGTFGISHDITEIKKAEQKLNATLDDLRLARDAAESANRAKSNFLANMSHEIRTPMNAIIGITELVMETELNSTQKDYLGTVLESGESLLSIINEILDFSKIEAGKVELEIAPFRLREEIGDTMKSLGVRAHGKNLELAWQAGDDVPDALMGDRSRLRQIIVNLAGNAIKFTERGEIVLQVKRLERHDDSVELQFSVRDTGLGISEDKLSKIFDVFEQADSSTTRQFGGTGLGLSISSSLVALMQGRLWVESQPGEGSTFHFTAHFKVAGESDVARDSVPSQSLVGMRVLIVDDNETNRLILKEIVASWKMQAISCAGGAEALETLQKTQNSSEPIQLVLSDVNMPSMDGFMLAQQIRKIPRGGDVAIIMLTSGTRPEDKDYLPKFQIAAELLKPVKRSELLNTIMQSMMPIIEQPPTTQTSKTESPDTKKLKILLAEDGLANQKLAVGLLQKWGHHVAVANNGKEALQILESDSFDLVLMDVQMPEMDGLEATKLIRQREENTPNHIPIVAMTARALKGDREKCLDAGMDGYVSKPIRRNELQDAINEFFHPESTEDAKTRQPSETINWQSAWHDVGESAELLVDVVHAASAELPELVRQLRVALDQGNYKESLRLAHTIRGTVRIFACKKLAETVTQIEELNDATAPRDAQGLMSKLDIQIGLFLSEAQRFLDNPNQPF